MCCLACRAKIVEGRVAKTLKTVALLEQPFIKDGDRSVATVIKEAVATLGENIQVRRFERCAAAAGPPASPLLTSYCQKAPCTPGLAPITGGTRSFVTL